MPNITITTHYHLLLFQVSHYQDRVANARNLSERIFLKAELYNFKQSLTAYLN